MPNNGRFFASRLGPPATSNLLAIDDESLVLGDLVVKRARGAVGFMRLPVDARRADEFCLLVHGFDQRAADALAARGLEREKILQIADRLDHRGAAMKQVVREPEQFAAAFSDEAV